MRRASHDEGNIALGKVGFNVRQSLIEKNVVAQVCAGEVGDGGKIYQQRQTQCIGSIHCAVQRRVIQAALGALHPVDDAGAVAAGWAVAANGYARVGSEIPQREG